MDRYEDLVFRLGDTAYERLWNKPQAPAILQRVIQAAEAYEARQLELREIEEAMDAEEASFTQLCDADGAEEASCQALVERHKKAVALAESKARAIEGKLVSRRKDVSSQRAAVARIEKQIRELEELGEIEKSRRTRETLRQAKLDLMKRSRDCDDMQIEHDRIMNPETGPAAEAIRARRRQKELRLQIEERTASFNVRLDELSNQAQAKDSEVKSARDAYHEALTALGEEVYRLRIPDLALTAFYAKIDKVVR